jgi:Acetyltransferase (GNAT) domain
VASYAAPLPSATRALAVPAQVSDAGTATAADWRTMRSDIAAWDALSADATEPNPFFESWYLLPSLEAYDPHGAVRLLRFEHEGKLAGLMPITRRSDYYGKPMPHLANWLHDNTFLGAPLVMQGREVQFWHALLGWADRNAGAALFLHLNQCSLDGPIQLALDSVLTAQGRPGWIVRREDRAILSSPLGADEYRKAAFSADKRKDLRRRLARLGDLGDVRFVWNDDADGIEAWAEQYLALEASGWKGKAGSAMTQDPAKRAIFTQSLAEAARRGRLLRLALTLDGAPVAMLSTFVSPPGAFGYKTAFDERFSKFAPGILIENEFLAALDQGRFAWCDSCAAADHAVMNGVWRERRSIGKLSIAIGGGLRRLVFNQLAQFEKGKIAAGVPA